MYTLEIVISELTETKLDELMKEEVWRGTTDIDRLRAREQLLREVVRNMRRHATNQRERINRASQVVARTMAENSVSELSDMGIWSARLLQELVDLLEPIEFRSWIQQLRDKAKAFPLENVTLFFQRLQIEAKLFDMSKRFRVTASMVKQKQKQTHAQSGLR